MLYLQDNLAPYHSHERLLPCIILADCSGSMAGAPIAELNQGLLEFGKALQPDPLANGRVDVCVMSFADGVKTELGFRSAEDYQAPTLTAGGLTSFNEAVNTALEKIDARKADYRQLGIYRIKPLLFVLTGSFPTDEHLEADTRERLQNYIANKKVNYIPIGTGSANISHLQSYYPNSTAFKPVLKAEQTCFKDVFKWLAASIHAIFYKADPYSGSVATPPVPSTITLIR